MCWLEEKIALVTGGGKRIGRSIALALGRAGADVFVHYRNSREEAEEVAEKIQQFGAGAWPVQADFSDPEETSRLFQTCVKRGRPVQILVNSASIFPKNTLSSVAVEDFVTNLNVNTFSPFLLSRAFAEKITDGVIINFLDSRFVDYDRNHVAYHLSKRAFFTICRMMTVEFAPDIRVNAIAPGLILPPPGENASYLEKMAGTNLLNTHGDTQDIAEAAIYLVNARFVTGQVIFVDGGRHLKGNMYGA